MLDISAFASCMVAVYASSSESGIQLHRAHVAPPLHSPPLPTPPLSALRVTNICTVTVLPLPSPPPLRTSPPPLHTSPSPPLHPLPPPPLSSLPLHSFVSTLCKVTWGHCKACVQDYKPNARDWLSSYWKGFMSPDQMARIRNTGVPMDFLKEVPPTSCAVLFLCIVATPSTSATFCTSASALFLSV